MKVQAGTAPKACIVASGLHAKHDLGGHPENKRRINSIWDALRVGELLSQVKVLEAQPLRSDELTLVHDPLYVRWLQELAQTAPQMIGGDTYIAKDTYEAAAWSAGCAVGGLEAIMDGEVRRAFALCRPPGHHAFRDRAMGFCFFNNVAIAARVAQVRFSLAKVAIIDWDVHHGNGTQAIFYDDPSVLFVSLHQHPAYPGTGLAHETGAGAGQGFTLNIPLPSGSTDSDYLANMLEIVLPKLDAFRPELILVSAGQDALAEDPLAGMELTPQVYAVMTRELMRVADCHAEGRMLMCLEGGYHLAQQAQAVRAIIEALAE
ncbi:MAG: Histone deacetylase-like amidohydrolase [Firmicutes bacterium]|nr:Histone deacetylase-like amidohydrolase [candidate division NPL-UPA2 bacterium]